MDRTPLPIAPRDNDFAAWWHLLPARFFRFRMLLARYWWIVFITCGVGLAIGSWRVAQEPVTYTSTGRMMVSGKINLPETAFSEEMNFFMNTQRELMQDAAVRQRAEERLRTTNPEIPASPVQLSVQPLPQTSIFLLTASGSDPKYPQFFLDSVMQEFIATRREMRSQKSEETEVSIEEEIARVKAELKAEEEKGLAFQRENNVGFLEQEGNSAGAYLSKLNTKLADAKQESQLLELFELDQNLARDQRQRSAADADSGSLRDGDPRQRNGPELEYLRARQLVEILKTQRASYAQDLRPKHPIMTELDFQISHQQQFIETFRKQSSDELNRRREAARMEIANIERTITEWEAKALHLSQRLMEYNTILANVARVRGQLESLSRSKGSIEINRGVDQEIVSIRQKATPTVALKINATRTRLAASAFGLLVGLVLLLLLDRLDDRVASMSEFQAYFSDRILAQLPNVSERGSKARVPLLRPKDPRHQFAEAFRSLRSSLIFLPVDGPAPKVLLIASALPSEGKSTVAVNLAITLALADSRVLLVDGDLRRGELHRPFDLTNEQGFSDILSGICTLESALQMTSVPGLSLLSKGASVSNPGELFLGQSADHFLQEAHAQFDYVIIDSAPVMAADDTTSLAPKADATLFVFRFTSSGRRVSRKAMALLRERQANLIGIVCNDLSEAMQERCTFDVSEYYGIAESR